MFYKEISPEFIEYHVKTQLGDANMGFFFLNNFGNFFSFCKR